LNSAKEKLKKSMHSTPFSIVNYQLSIVNQSKNNHLFSRNIPIVNCQLSIVNSNSLVLNSK